MKKDIIIIIIYTVFVLGMGYYLGYKSAKTEIINNALENKKDCYNLEDIRLIIDN